MTAIRACKSVCRFAALRAVFLCLLSGFVAIALVPAMGHSEESRQALVVYLVSDDEPDMRGWALATNTTAPEGAMDGPMQPATCAIVGAMRIANWADDNWRNFSVREMRCIPVSGVDAFFRSHDSLAEKIAKERP